MRLKPKIWAVVGVLLLACAIGISRYAARHAVQPANPSPRSEAKVTPHPPLIKTAATNAVATRKSYRLSNTHQTIAQLLHNPHALILRNALIDTEVPVALKIPDHLRAKGAPGSYLVQSDRPLDKGFYAELSKAGAMYVSYVPNNAALVKATPETATNLAAQPDIVAVLPYEPYYKLDSTLLPSAVEQQPSTNQLSITTYPGQRDAALAELTQLGASMIGEDRSPFGPTLVMSVPSNSLTAIAQMPLAQEIEVYTPRHKANDLTRFLMGESVNTLIGTSNYLSLTGSNVTVNINDTGVDSNHPDFGPPGRLIGNFPSSLTDDDGHGTHVAGIIAGNGSQSQSVTYPIPGSVTNADFRGKATNATLFVQGIDIYDGAFIPDSYLQENASTNLGPTNLISNNSWGYGSTVYDMHSASYDAATRDAQPNVDGEQPLLFVFAAGNNGNNPESIISPGTAKNVITVGASDSPRFITNLVYETPNTNATSQVFLGDTSYTNQVASFSSGGNVGLGTEGFYGRFKPDVVAPGVFTISCRPTNYMDPTNSVIVLDESKLGQTVTLNQTNFYGVFLPDNPFNYSASGLTIIVTSNLNSPTPFPTNMIIFAEDNPPGSTTTNIVSTNDFYSVPSSNIMPGDFWIIGVAAPTNSPGPVNYDLDIYVYETNYLGDYFQVLSNLNNPLKPYYMYQSGTSMSAGAVSGTLALVQEFLRKNMSITNPTPALMKAMLINGSRTLGLPYDLDVTTTGVNLQGWGLPYLPDVIPVGLTNSTNASMVLVDQSTNRALATGQYQTYSISCSDTNATNFPLRITLVWTDPPGDPAAGVALVNNLELTVADNSGSNIFIGNNFLSGDIFTEPSSPTNLPAGESDNDVENVYVNQGTATFTSAGDVINNVQNVYINPTNSISFPLTITISGTRINVNAVTTQTSNILQDYALVISSDDPKLTSALTVASNVITSTNAPLITVASNGVPLLHQRVGANEPNLYNFQTGSTNGSFAQWHFFIFTNSDLVVSNTTNVAFATFLPPNLSIPRASGSADIDMYVYTNTITTDFGSFIEAPGSLDTFASGAVKSVGRTGTESVIFTNSTVQVYYIGIKSEDQQASDFGFYAIAQQQPFSTTSADGHTITATATGLPVFIPNTFNPQPALVFAFMFNPNPALSMIRRATVNLGIQYGDPSSLIGTLQHDGVDMVLNASGNPGGFTNTYDDLQEDPNSGDVTSDGPGSLAEYVNQNADGLWLLTEANSSFLTNAGYVNQYSVSVDLQQPQTAGFFVTIPGQSWFDDYVDVPNDTTNLIIYALYESEGTNGAGTGPIGIYLTNEVGDITFSDYGSNNISPPGGSLSLATNNPVPGWPGAPPLAGGYWYYGIYNYSTEPVTLYVQIVFQESLTPNLVQSYTNNDFTPLTTDGHTQSQICISNGQQLVDMQVGLRINDTNLDDLVIHLTSPEGTSMLLFEDRGGTNAVANELGLSLVTSNGTTNLLTNYVYTVFTEDTNLTTIPIKFAPPPYAQVLVTPPATLVSNSFEDVAAGVYTNGAILDGWLVTNTVVDYFSNGMVGSLTNDEVGIVTDPAGDQTSTTNLGSNYLALTSARIVQTFGATNKFTVTNGLPYELVFYAKPMGVTNWWPGNGNTQDIISGDTGTIPYHDVTYSQGEYDQAFAFSGIGQNPDFNNGNEVDFGTSTGNFGTNDYSIDFWVKVPTGQTGLYGVMEKRQECGPYLSYFDIHLGHEPALTTSVDGAFFFDSADNGPVDFDVVVSTNKINDGKYHHAAFVRQGLTNSIYIDGQLATNGLSSPGVVNISNNIPLRIGNSECVAPGVGITDVSQPFNGDLDEIDVVNRALSPAEVYAIYHAGTLGKYNTNSVRPNFTLTIDGVETNTVVLTNSAGGWELFTNSFTATNSQITIEFAGNPMGVLLDDIQLVQLPATNYNNYYLPEEPLTPFIGENPLGCWTLDVWDTRQDSPLPTNGDLLSWTMQLTTSSTNATLYVLTNGQPFTVTNAESNSITYFAIDVPSYATYATNLLTANAGNAVSLLFDQNALPTGGLPGDYTLASGVTPVSTSTNILSTIGLPPPLLPGRRYFLGVLDNGAGNANFTLQVNFNISTNKIIELANQIPYTNTVGTASLGTNGPEYYSFLVPTNAIMATFQILGPTNGEVDLYAREGLPVPGPSQFDYASANAGTNDQFIVVTTNSLPVPLPIWTNILPVPTPTTWYLAAYNPAGVSNITYSIIASFVTNTEMDIIKLTNAQAYINTAAPGYPTNLLYSFTVTNNPSGVEFTVTNLTNAGNVQLLADINGFPTPQDPYAASYNTGTNSQLIEIVTSANLPSLNGIWYLSVPNTSTNQVKYSIEAQTNFIVPPPITPLTWSGAVSGVWDILATSNWVATSNHITPYPYQDGTQVTFDDSATNGPTTIDLVEAVAPASVILNNNILLYTFTGVGGISGAPLTMGGFGMLILDNAGQNNFSSVSIGAETLQIGNNDARGSVGSNTLDTGTGTLTFDRVDNITISNAITDGGNLQQIGSGVLTLAGINSYSGSTLISNGTVVVDNTNALGSGTGGFSPVTIENGGTLDLGGIPISYGPASPLFDGKYFSISGSGANGNGAIVNNGTNAQFGGLEVLFLGANATIGGTARWDIRNAPDTIKFGGHTLNKTGTNQINLASTTLQNGDIVIAQGILSLEGTPHFTPNPSDSITVNSGGLLGGISDTLGSITWPIVLNGGGFTNMSTGGISYLDAPILLSNNAWLGNGFGYEIFNGSISGSFALTNLGLGSNLFSTTNTYTGATYVAQGTLVLTNLGAISNSATILVSPGATLDASERIDQTLTLASNQTLINDSLVAGNVLAGAGSSVLGTGVFSSNLMTSPGSTLSPGPDAVTIGVLTGNTAVMLGGTTVMKLNKALAPAQSNDVLVASNLFLGGTLIVTNFDNVDQFVAGDSFRIFVATNTIGNFATNLMPPLPPGLSWTNNFAGQGGTITVINQSAVSGPPVQMSIVLSGSNVTFSGTNGTPGGQYVLLTSTNLTAPVSSWTPVVTNFFDNNGDFSVTEAVSNVQAQFYILQTP